MAAPVYNSENVIDSRDVIEHISNLEDDIECYRTDIGDHEDDIDAKRVEIEDLQAEQEERDSGNALDDDMAYNENENEIAALRSDIDSIEQNISSTRNDISTAQDELKPLLELAEQCENYGDWAGGMTLISDAYFEDYAKELAMDDNSIDDAEWPYTHIDWAAAADALLMDYTCVDFDGVEYWIR